MGHSYNNGLHTTSKGITYDNIRVTALNVANGQVCTIAEDCKSGLVSSITHTALGVYTFQMTAPYPPKMVRIDPSLSASGPTAAVLTARYTSASYNATTGQFVVNVSNAGTATDGGATDELMVHLALNRYTR